MLKLKSLCHALGAIALATVGMTANAGSWPSTATKKVAQVSGDTPAMMKVAKSAPAAAPNALSNGDFEYVGNEAGWQLRQHQLVLSGGSITHSPKCVLAANAAAAATQPAAASKPYLPAGDRSLGA